MLDNHKGLQPIYQVIELGKTVSMDLSSPEAIYTNIKKNKRNKINKAPKSSINVSWGADRSLFDSFKAIYNETMSKNAADPYYYFQDSFYDSIMKDLKDNALIFYCHIGNEIIAATIFLLCNGQMHAHLGGTKTQYLPYSPDTILTYKSALWGYENGYRTLHLGGGVSGREDSLFRFKSDFNKKSTRVFAIGKKVFNRGIYESLVKMRQKKDKHSLNPDYFPQYRA